jgi:hypothetical protein
MHAVAAIVAAPVFVCSLLFLLRCIPFVLSARIVLITVVVIVIGVRGILHVRVHVRARARVRVYFVVSVAIVPCFLTSCVGCCPLGFVL